MPLWQPQATALLLQRYGVAPLNGAQYISPPVAPLVIAVAGSAIAASGFGSSDLVAVANGDSTVTTPIPGDSTLWVP